MPELQSREREVARLLSDSPQVPGREDPDRKSRPSLEERRRENVPDLFLRGVGLHYDRERERGHRQRVGWEGFVEAGISIPLFNQNQGNIAAARAQLDARSGGGEARLELALRGQLSGILRGST